MGAHDRGPYKGETGEDYDALIDAITGVCASDDDSAVLDLYASGVFRGAVGDDHVGGDRSTTH